MAFPVAVWLMMRAGVSTNVAIGIAPRRPDGARLVFDFSAVMALMAPVILIGGMTLGLFTPTEARRRGRDLVSLPRPRALSLHDA